ncbi:MAG: hypothetical protein RLZZ612_2615 [Pseudomonadota bacterium]|jgi:Ser/Thr protein kinase RdoA (MazF antagonist)
MHKDWSLSEHTDEETPYACLTPERVLDALDQVGLIPDGRLTALSSYENRVYQCGLDEPHQGHSSVVLKFYRPGRWSADQIEEEHRFAHALQAAEVPVVAPLMWQEQSVHRLGDFYFSVSPYRGGRRPELDNEEVLMWTGRFLARLHTVGEQQGFTARPQLSITHFGHESRDWLAAHEAVAWDVRSRWERTLDQALTLIAKVAPELGADTTYQGHLRLHGDCHPGNILWTPIELPQGGPHFVDLDDARMGPAVQDLWMLLPGGSRGDQTYSLSVLIEGYEQYRPFNRRELALIEPLRTLRHIHYSAWLARRWKDPIFPHNFPWFGSSAYWAGQVQQLELQIEAMQEAPLEI